MWICPFLVIPFPFPEALARDTNYFVPSWGLKTKPYDPVCTPAIGCSSRLSSWLQHLWWVGNGKLAFLIGCCRKIIVAFLCKGSRWQQPLQYLQQLRAGGLLPPVWLLCLIWFASVLNLMLPYGPLSTENIRKIFQSSCCINLIICCYSHWKVIGAVSWVPVALSADDVWLAKTWGVP